MSETNKPLCPCCGSDAVHCTIQSAYDWNATKQCWQEAESGSYGYCDDCCREVDLVDENGKRFECFESFSFAA